MPNTRTCDGCGAPRTDADSDRCAHCGRAFAPPSATHAAADAARFRTLAAHSPRNAGSPPAGFGPAAGMLAGAVFGAVFCIVPILMLTSFGGPEPPGLFRVVPILFMLVGATITVVSLIRFAGYLSATAEQRPVLVVGKRAHHHGGRDNRGTSYHATLQFENGDREEFRTSGRLSGSLAEGDMGYAWIRGRHLIGFDRVAV